MPTGSSRFWDSLESDTVTVVAFQSDHRISTYRLLALSQRFHELKQRGRVGGPGAVGQERWRTKAEAGKDSSNITGRRAGRENVCVFYLQYHNVCVPGQRTRRTWVRRLLWRPMWCVQGAASWLAARQRNSARLQRRQSGPGLR